MGENKLSADRAPGHMLSSCNQLSHSAVSPLLAPFYQQGSGEAKELARSHTVTEEQHQDLHFEKETAKRQTPSLQTLKASPADTPGNPQHQDWPPGVLNDSGSPHRGRHWEGAMGTDCWGHRD